MHTLFAPFSREIRRRWTSYEVKMTEMEEIWAYMSINL